MSWLVIAAVAYLLIALEVILDKFLLSSRRVSHPSVYAFYSGILSLFAFAFFPFGFHGVGVSQLFLSLFSGAVFVYGILALFFAIRESEASRVTPVVGAVIPAVAYFLSIFFLKEQLEMLEIYGVLALILGGIGISFNIDRKDKKIFFSGLKYSVLAGMLLAVAFTCFKSLYESDNFINVYIWTRFGVMLGALGLFLSPSWRKIIFNSISNFKNPSGENKRSGLLFVFTKSLGGTGSILKEYATSIGSVTIVSALISLEYVFIFIMGIFLTFWLPEIFSEKRDSRNIAQKLLAVAVITIGVILVSGYK